MRKFTVEVEVKIIERFEIIIESEKDEDEIDEIYRYPYIQGSSIECIEEYIKYAGDKVLEVDQIDEDYEVDIVGVSEDLMY